MPAYKDAQKGTWYAAFLLSGLEGIKKKRIKARFSHKEKKPWRGNAHFFFSRLLT